MRRENTPEKNVFRKKNSPVKITDKSGDKLTGKNYGKIQNKKYVPENKKRKECSAK